MDTANFVSKYKRMLKAPYSLKNRHFIIQEGFNEVIYGINTIIKCDTWQPVKFQLVYHSWNEMIFMVPLN